MELKERMQRLSSMDGPAGFESFVAAWLLEEIEPYCHEAWMDPMGNVIAVHRCGQEHPKKILVDAHMDEIGLIVTGVEHGFLRFATLGGVDPRVLPAMQVRVLTQPPIKGVIDSMPPHALRPEDMEKPFAMDMLAIDIGMSQEQAESAVPLGTAVVYNVDPVLLGEHRLCGKALDDRACVGVVCKLMEELANQQLNGDVYFLFSTQEEVGRRGAQAAVDGIAPDYAFVLDVTFAKSPDARGYDVMTMGKGPAIGIGPNMNYALTCQLVDTAKKLEIPYQMEVLRGDSGTNAWPIQVARQGVATAVVSLPLKYMHTPHEVIDLRDGEHMVQLLSEVIRGI